MITETQIQELIEKIVKANALAVEELTEAQLVETIKQMIKAGDFIRYLHPANNSQCIVYLPYNACIQLRTRIYYLEDLLNRNNIAFEKQYYAL